MAAEETKVAQQTPEAKPGKVEISEAIRKKFLGQAADLPKRPDPKAEKPDEKPTPQAPPQDTPQEEPKEKKAATPEPEKKDEPKPKKQKAPAKIIQASEIDPEAITRAATSAAVAAVQATKEQEPKKPKEEVELPKDIERRLDYYKELEALDPRYKGITEKVVAFSKKGGAEDQYIAAWKKENPGKEYDPDSEDHEDFYRTNAPDYEEADFEAARETVIERRAVEKAKKAMEPTFEKQRKAQIEKETAPKLDQASYSVIAGSLGAIDEGLLKVAQEKGDQGLEETNPLAAQIVSEVVPQYEALAHEAVKVFNGLVKVNPEKPAASHRQLDSIALKLNDAIGRIAEEDPNQALKPIVRGGRTVGYKQFATYEQYQRLGDDERDNYWIVGEDEVLAHISALAAREVKAKYDRVVTAAEKALGAKTRQSAPEKKEEKKAESATPTATPAKSVTVGASSQTPTPTGGAAKDDSAPGAKFAKSWLGR